MARRPRLPTGYFQRGEVIWCRTDPVTGKQVSTGLRDPKAIKSWERDRQAKASDPAVVASFGATLGAWVDKIVEIKEVDKSAATVSIYRQKLGAFVAFWGKDFALARITPSACDEYVKRRRLKVTDHTITKEFSALSQLLKAAKRVGCYPGDISSLRPQTVAPRYKPRERHLSPAELDKLLAECSPKLRAIAVVAVCLGARLSEALKFAPADLAQGVAHLRGTKTEGSDRSVPVLAPFRPLLESVTGELPVGEYPNNLRRDLARACKRAGIPTCTPNDLRRTHASLLVAAGVDKEVVRRLLGHKTSRMVEMVYGKTDPGDLERLAAPMVSSLLLGPSKGKSATENATLENGSEGREEPQPNSGANSEGRTRDLWFTKPNADRAETPETAGIAYNGDTARHVETPRDTGTRATESATVDVAALRELRDAWEAYALWDIPRDPVSDRLARAVEAVTGGVSLDVRRVGS